MKKYLLGLLSLIFLWFNQCSSKKDETQENYVDLKNHLSEIHLPIVYSVERLEELVNRQLKEVLYEDDSFEKPKHDNLKLTVRRAGRVTLKVEENEVYYVVPLKLDCQWQKKPLPIVKTSFSLKVRGKSTVEIEKDWHLHTNSKYLGIEWIEHPKVDIGLASINVSSIVEKVLQAQGQKLFDKLDEEVAKKADLKPEIEKIWNDIQKPLCINRKEKKVWLKFDNQDIAASQVQSYANNVLIHTNIHTYVETIIADTVEKLTLKPLPKLKKIRKKDKNNRFEMNILSIIPFNELNSLASKYIKDRVLTYQGRSITIQEARIYGKKGNLEIELNVTGEIDANVYLNATPHHDSLSNTLFLRNFDFVFQTDNSVVQALDWLLHETVKENLSSYLSLPLQPYIEKLPELINKGVEKGKVGKRLDLKLKNVAVCPKKILITPHNVQLLIQASGNGTIILEKLGKLE